MLIALAFLLLLVLAMGLLLYIQTRKVSLDYDSLIDQVDEILPQTQCGQCGFGGCRPYARAIVRQRAPINQCPPGGTQTILELSDLLGVDPVSLNPAFGTEQPPTVALIDEPVCIGCTKCIQACPVDAIVGASKQMHTVISDLCTGCELCVAPCPVDCIDMVSPHVDIRYWKWPKPVEIATSLEPTH